MNAPYLVFFGITGVLLALLAWALRNPRKSSPHKLDLASLEQSERRHATYFALIRQALSPADFAFLASRGSAALTRRVKKQRRRVVLLYLRRLRADFQCLLRLARALAALSPEVGAGQEFERLLLSALFSCRYQMVRLTLRTGLLAVPQLSGLSQLVSELAVRMEGAVRELGERAALTAKLGSSLDRRGI